MSMMIRSFQHVTPGDERVDHAGVGSRRPEYLVSSDRRVKMRPQVAKYSVAGEGLDQCLLGKARFVIVLVYATGRTMARIPFASWC